MEYFAVSSIEDACSLLAERSGSRILAGGTDLLVQMRAGLATPRDIIDIKHIPGLCAISLDEKGLTIGAAAPAQSITERDEVAALYPGLVEAIDLIGSTQIQGRCSVGGNLCNASPAAYTVPALIANGTLCNIAGPGGERQLPVEAFNSGPGQNCLAQGEFLISLFVPRPAARTADAYLRFIPRTEMDIAVVGAGVSISLNEAGQCSAARVAIGAVAPTALLVEEAAAALIGQQPGEPQLQALAEACRAAAKPISDKRGSADYRRQVVGVMARRAAEAAVQRASSGTGGEA